MGVVTAAGRDAATCLRWGREICEGGGFSERSRLPRIPPSPLVRKNDRQEPLEGLFSVDGVGLAGGHYERLASLDLVLNAVHRVLAYTLQDIRPRVANGLVGADLLTLVNT